MKTNVTFSGTKELDISIPDEINGNPLKVADYLYKYNIGLPKNTEKLFDINIKEILSNNILDIDDFELIQSRLKDNLYLKTKYDLSGKEFYKNDKDTCGDWHTYIIVYTNQNTLSKQISNYLTDNNNNIAPKEFDKFIMNFYQAEIERLQIKNKTDTKLELNKIYRDQPDVFGFDIDNIGLYDITQTILIYLLKKFDQKIINKLINISVYDILTSFNDYTHELIDPNTHEVLMTIATMTTIS